MIRTTAWGLSVSSLLFFASPCPTESAGKETKSASSFSTSSLEPLSEEGRQLAEKWIVPLHPELHKESLKYEMEQTAFVPWTLPATSLITPVAYGANWGDLFAGFSIQNRLRFSNLPDGAAGAGIGFGHSRKWVGVELNYTMYNLSALFPWNSEGSLGLKVHRMLPWDIAIAAGFNDLIQWMNVGTYRSFYAVASKSIYFSRDEKKPFNLLFLHAGVGNGNFQTEANILQGLNYLNVFASAGLRIIRPLALIVNWYGSNLGIGLSYAPFRRFRFVVTPSLIDLTRASGNGTRFMVTVSFAENFVTPAFLFR
jgi:hypothetical protein